MTDGTWSTGADDFVAYEPSHQLALVVFVVGAVLLVRLGRSHRGTVAADRFCRGYALLIPLFTVPLQAIDFTPERFSFTSSLPLQLCDLAWVAAVIALWTRRWWAVALTHYWGLTLTTQAMITPALHQDFPDPRFLMFWGMHFLIVWAAIYLTWGLGLVPDWRKYRLTVGVTVVWAVSVFTFNSLADTNYGYLNAKPSTASVLDLLGPWPLYVVLEIAIVVSVWALMTWPWTRDRSGRDVVRT